MKRPYLTFLATVVAPSAAAIVAAGWIASDAWTDLHRDSHVRVARMALASFEQEVGAVTDTLLGRTEPVADPDAAEPAVRRALAGDTVAAVGIEGTQLRISVVVPDGGPGGVRFASEALTPSSQFRVGRATGYAVSLYLRGSRWASTEPPAGPERLGDVTFATPERRMNGAPLEDGPGGAIAVPTSGPPEDAPALVAVVRPMRAPDDAVALPVILVVSLLLVFSALAGWIQLARPAGTPPVRSSMLLLSFVPALTVLVFMMHLVRTHHDATADALSRDLGRALTVARSQGMERSPEAVRELSSFHATRIMGGEIEASTYERPPESLARLPVPPPSFTSAGRMDAPDGTAVYAGSRLTDGSVIVVSGTLPAARAAALRRAMTVVGAVLAGWLLLVGLVTAGADRRAARVAVSSDR